MISEQAYIYMGIAEQNMNELVRYLTEPFLVNDELEVLPTQEEIMEFIKTDDFKNAMVNEQTNTVSVGAVLAVDDGPNYHYSNHEIYKRVSKKRAEMIGWTVINYVLSGGKDGENPNPPTYPNGPVRSVSFFPAGIAGIKTPTNQDDLVGSEAWNKWFTHVTRKASMAGYALVKTREERLRTAQEKKQSGLQSRADITAEKDRKHGGLAEHNDRPLHTYNLALESTGFSNDIKKKYRINEDDTPDSIRHKVTTVRDFRDHGVLFEGDIDDDNRNVVKHLVEFTIEELGITKRPPIKLTDEREDIETTAYYRPDTHEIKIYTKGRALADYLRSVVHEMVHHKQNEDGRLDATSGDGSKWAIDKTDPLETEAHALAGDIITKFKKLSERNIYLNEEIMIDVNVGDTILTGKFKNKKTVVKSIGTDEHGMPTINGRKVVTFRLSQEAGELTEDVTKTALDSIERFADRVLAPFDVEFTKHFFDRVNDPRNKKPISGAELISFFKRLAKDKAKLADFLKKYRELVATDKQTDINIPFVSRVNSMLAKTIMRKPGFKTPDAKLTINEDWL